MTNRQLRVFLEICHLADLGEPITYRKLARRLGLRSPNAIMCHIRPLLKAGFISGPVFGQGRHAPNKKTAVIRPLYRAVFLLDNEATIPPKSMRTGETHAQDSGR